MSADSACGFNAVELWEINVEQNHVGTQFSTLLHRLQAIRRFADDLEFPALLQHCGNATPPGAKVINKQNTNWRQLAIGLPPGSEFKATPSPGGAKQLLTNCHIK